MLILDVAPELRAHLAVAIRDHVRRLRRDGQAVPADLSKLADALLSQPGAARSSQQQPPLVNVAALPDPGNGTPAGPLLLRATDAAALIGCSVRQLARKTAAGEIASVRDGRSRRFRPADLAAYVEARATDDIRPARVG